MSTVNNIKAAFVGCDEIKNYFSTSNCVVAVSVGSEVHEGENFKATMNLVNSHFPKCTVLIGDSLQRHNLVFTQPQPRKSSDNDYKESLFLGDQWLVRNSDTLASLTIPCIIRRWDEWLKNAEFEINLNKIKIWYEGNAKLRESIDFTIEEFIQRYYSKNEKNSLTREVIFYSSKSYLLEEIAILMLMLPKEKESYNYLIYPNKPIKAFDKSYELFVKPEYPNLMKWVQVRFRKRSFGMVG